MRREHRVISFTRIQSINRFYLIGFPIAMAAFAVIIAFNAGVI
jgi:hypothetical protein